ncbi:expansin family protein [Rhodotorula toruloides]|uniref:Expansin family protein n=1 Tax=Rhodotorula toruloides TaxID=5286 RepID=A0A511K6X0_RHOTO|nr:expansin family protein [Rhodotorula toruloides]
MYSHVVVAALAAIASVQAAPLPILATVEAALSTPNTTQYNQTAVSYYMNGHNGACGWANKDSDKVVGLPNEFYQDLSSVSPYCGKYVVVTDPRVNKTVTALVADASTGNNTLSLSQGTWNALNGTASHLKSVDWRFANETETAAAKAALSSAAPAPSSTTAAQQQQQQKQEQPTSSQKQQTTQQAYTTTQAPWTTSYAPKPTTTTTTQAQATPQKASYGSSASSGTYSGQATYFFQNGVAGACGSVHSDSDYIIAIDSAMWAGGAHCGQTVHITNTKNGKSVTATVADEGAFNAIGSESDGVEPITWSF